jgi:hypothetical protein
MHLVTITAYTMTPRTRSKRIAVDSSESDEAELRQMAEEHHLPLTRLAAIAIGDLLQPSRAGGPRPEEGGQSDRDAESLRSRQPGIAYVQTDISRIDRA